MKKLLTVLLILVTTLFSCGNSQKELLLKTPNGINIYKPNEETMIDIGETWVGKSFDITLKDFEEQSLRAAMLAPPDCTYLVCEFEFINNTNAPAEYGPSSVVLYANDTYYINDENLTFDYSFEMSSMYGNAKKINFKIETINAGMKFTSYSIFVIPKDVDLTNASIGFNTVKDNGVVAIWNNLME